MSNPGKSPMNPAAEPADIQDSPRQDPRLPPGQIVTDKWPVLHYGSVPAADLTRQAFSPN